MRLIKLLFLTLFLTLFFVDMHNATWYFKDLSIIFFMLYVLVILITVFVIRNFLADDRYKLSGIGDSESTQVYYEGYKTSNSKKIKSKISLKWTIILISNLFIY